MSDLNRIIQEIARLSGIDESILSSFTEEQLREALNAISCDTPPSPIFTQDQLDDAGCEKEARDLPPLQEEPNIDIDFTAGEDALKCKEKVDEFNKILEKEIEEYKNLNLILERLLEYKYSYDVMKAYYEKRSETMGLLLNRYQPLLESIREIEDRENRLRRYQRFGKSNIPEAIQLLNESGITYDPEELGTVQNINALISKAIRKSFQDKAKKFSIIRNLTANEPILKDSNSIGFSINKILEDDSVSSTERARFNNEAKRLLDNAGFNKLEDSLKRYNDYFRIKRNSFSLGQTSSSVARAASQPLISFTLKFPNLFYMPIDEDIYNKQNGERSTRSINFRVKNSPFLKDNIFFESLDGFTVSNINVDELEPTGDALYGKYYFLLSDPLKRMFTPEDRGLTTNINLIDPNLRGTGLETKREGNTTYYVSDNEKLQKFYEEFEDRFNVRKQQIYSSNVLPAFNRVKGEIERLADAEIRILLSLGRVNLELLDENVVLKGIVNSVEEQQNIFIKRLRVLENEISRIQARIEEIKPTPERIRERLTALDAKCFEDKSQPEPADCPGKDQLGIDPFYDATLSGIDPTLPDPSRLCYWKEFAKIVNRLGLFPIPDGPGKFRYWPVGFVIPTPKPIKIPLPIIWIPIIAVSSPFGVIVTFITINGIYVSPVIFFASSSGFKQHILTLKGSSKKFGYETGEEVKDTINIPLATLSIKEKILNLGKPQFSTKDAEEEYNTKKENILQKISEAKSSGDERRVKRLNKKIEDLEESVSKKGPYEKLSNAVDAVENAEKAIEDTKKSILDRIEDLRLPDLEKINFLKTIADKRKQKLQDELTAALEDGDKEEIEKLRRKLESDGLNLDEKIKAISDDVLEFYDKIELPTIKIPKDPSKVDPKPNPSDSFKTKVSEFLTDRKFDLIPPENRNIRQILLKNISKVRDEIDLSGLEPNLDGKLDVTINTKKIKDFWKKATEKLFDKVTGKDTGEDVNILKSDRDKKQQALDSEGDADKQKELKKEIRKLDRQIFNVTDNKLIRESFAVNGSILSSISEFKIDYDPFKPCCASEEAGVDINLGTLPGDIFNLFIIVKTAIDNYIDGLEDETVIDLLGGVKLVSPEALKDAFFNIILSVAPNNISIPIELNLGTLATSFSGLLGTLKEPKAPVQVHSPISTKKQVTIDLNILKAPVRSALEGFMENLIRLDFPIDIENNFLNINGEDIKAALKRYVSDTLDNFTKLLDPVYSALSFAQSAKGVNLNVIEAAQHEALPYGTLTKASFNLSALKKIIEPTSASIKLTDLSALAAATPLVQKIVRPLFDQPLPEVVVAASILVKQQDKLRLLHPIMNADDIPPWERLSSKNFLLLLFVDEFISEAAEKIGFFRTYI